MARPGARRHAMPAKRPSGLHLQVAPIVAKGDHMRFRCANLRESRHDRTTPARRTTIRRRTRRARGVSRVRCRAAGLHGPRDAGRLPDRRRLGPRGHPAVRMAAAGMERRRQERRARVRRQRAGAADHGAGAAAHGRHPAHARRGADAIPAAALRAGREAPPQRASARRGDRLVRGLHGRRQAARRRMAAALRRRATRATGSFRSRRWPSATATTTSPNGSTATRSAPS